jgi:tetratricopeptide (TPR) repeat protein
MIEKEIKHLAYKLKRNKNKNKPGAIVFIGAGCSVSAGIPTADKIVDYVLEQHKENPDIKTLYDNVLKQHEKNLKENLNEKPTYADLMACLSPPERKEIFKYYVDNAKINVSHIYLAHLMIEGYVDYIVTVNFDDLAQKALALYNVFPPIYDISTIRDFTTTTLEAQSITYLHGQYNGLWQLNTKEEMDRVIKDEIAKDIFRQITNGRPWIVIGYSGEDKIFGELVKLGRFDDGLYWVGYKDSEPKKVVRDNLLDKQNSGSFHIKGYDSDSFFLKLNIELQEGQPTIFSSPFSFLSKVLEGIIDIENSEDYKSVKERFAASKENVEDAINRYEKSDEHKPKMTELDIEENQLRAKLIDCQINKKYNDLEELEKQVKDNKFDDLMPNVASIYYNWGTNLGNLAAAKTGLEAEALNKQSFEKFAKAIEIKPDLHEAYNNWGNNLGNLAKTKTGLEAEELYKQSFEKYAKAIEIKPDKHEAYYIWGNGLGNLAKTKTGLEADELYKQVFEKYAKAIEIKPDYYEAYCNWGTYLGNLAETKTGLEAEELYKQAFEKYAKAIEIKPDYHKALDNWANDLIIFARTKSDKEAQILLGQAFKIAMKTFELGGSAYNFACVNALTNKFDEAFRLLEICLEKNEITFEHVEKDEDWAKLRKMPKYKELKKRYLK